MRIGGRLASTAGTLTARDTVVTGDASLTGGSIALTTATVGGNAAIDVTGRASATTLARGASDSQRPSTTFCWLPPDSAPAVTAALGALMRNATRCASPARASDARSISPSRACRASAGSVTLRAIDRPSTSPDRLRSSGTR